MITKSFDITSFSNVTTVLGPDTNDYYVAAQECHRFVIENCWTTNIFLMACCAILIVFLAMTMYNNGEFSKEVLWVKEKWKRIRSR